MRTTPHPEGFVMKIRSSLSLSGVAALAIGLTLLPASVAFAADVDEAPVRVIAGDATLIDSPWGLTVGPDGRIYVVSRNSDSVLVFAADAVGNVAPIQVITGGNPDFQDVLGVAVGPDGLIYVGDDTGIKVFAADATGNAEPLRHITGFDIYYLTVGADGTVYATNNENGDVLVFAPGADGAAVPLAVYSTQLGSDSVGIDVDQNGLVAVSDFDADAVVVLGQDPDAAAERVIQGGATTIDRNFGIAVGCSGAIYVALNSSDSVVTFAAGADGNVAPERTLVGPTTQLDGPNGLALGPNGGLYIGNSEDNNITIYDGEATCRYEAAGAPAEPELAATGSDIASIIGLSGALLGAGAITLLVLGRRRASAIG